MKKIIVSIFVLLSVAVLTGCFADINTLEWETLPKSVYAKSEITESVFMKSVSIKIDGTKVTLEQAEEIYGAIVSGFDVASEGEKVITVKYKSLTIYWAYRVGAVAPTTVTPDYGWYGDGTATSFTINNEEDLYGFANIVNGKRPKNDGGFEPAISFLGKTVKLGADIDLTGQVWEPIGAAPRKTNTPLEFLSNVQTTKLTDKTKIYFFTDGKLWTANETSAVVTNEDALKSQLDKQPVDNKYYIGAYVFAEIQEDGDYSYNEKSYKFYYSDDELDGNNFFSGSFNGQGHTIKGLSDIGYTPTVVLTYANSSAIVTGYTFGLFGVVSGDVTVKNLVFEDFTIIGAYFDSNSSNVVLAEIDSVGAAIGYAFGVGNLIIENISVLSGSVLASGAGAGIIGRGYNQGTVSIKNCVNYVNVTIGEAGHGGGIGGYFAQQTGALEFLNCINYGNITSIIATSKTKGAGGIINRSNSIIGATFTNCRNFGDITGMTDVEAGQGIWTGDKPNNHHLIDCQDYGHHLKK